MFPFWESVIAPLLDAAQVRRVVEIGALRGENTVKMLEDLGPDTELHVIDPVPEFDPSEHEQRFGGRYVFHRDLSLNVLSGLPPMDAALVDGDHNWYTVVNELRQLAGVTGAAGLPMPILILHDVGWPYGRRDLYYAPDTIPEEFRRPWAQQGIMPGRKKLNPRNGINPTMCNAIEEGGPRNGVMTALEDFLAECGRPHRLLVLPVYFGLAIVVDQGWLDRRPEIGAFLDHLEAAGGKDKLIDIGETMRLDAMIFQHRAIAQYEERMDRQAHRYLEVLKGALLNEHYLEHEVRLATVTRAIGAGRIPEPDIFRDPARYDREALGELQHRRRYGLPGTEDTPHAFLPFTDMGRHRLDHLERTLDQIRLGGIGGDIVECGTGRGGGAVFAKGYVETWNLTQRQVWVADRFRSTPPPASGPAFELGLDGFQADLNLVRDAFDRFDLLDDRVRFLQGPLAATLPNASIGRIALLRIDGRLGDEVNDALELLYDKVAEGGVVIVDGSGAPGAREAADAFRARHGIEGAVEQISASAVCWTKAADHELAGERVVAPRTGLHAPLMPAGPAGGADLSVVIVFYNMKREAARSLHALSRAYQRDIDDLSYEVIVLENGSAPDQKLGEAFVSSFGPEFRYLDLGERAQPSPVFALNEGIRASTGRVVALMIDGAHILTPGVLRYGMLGISSYEPAIVATQQWYLGPGQQGEAMNSGYDQTFEDRLFEGISWPDDGYRLFEIGHFVGNRDWFDGLWESNCLFAPRNLLEQVGGFDESFDVAGGGYANLEIYERLGTTPGTRVVSILGEGSFHQVHGGTTTNVDDSDERRARVFSYGETFADLRGRPFKGPGRRIHYVGALPNGASRRSKGRRMTAEAFVSGRIAKGVDGRPETPLPVPDDLKVGFVDAVWNNQPWRFTSWLGRRIQQAPTDLLAYQEILSQVRPDWVIETGTGNGSRALFLASICDLLGHGQVISIDHNTAEDRPDHPRIHYLTGRALDSSIVKTVHQMVGEGRAVAVLGSRANRRGMVKEFEAYRDLVPVGGYVVVEDTILNGHPVWAGFGPGPREAVDRILNKDGSFAMDPTMEKYSLTFNPSGYLKRIR